ncbi:MAG: ATP synthase F0 subunit B [Candidatus Yonathbacteria bacterium CG10_big_fil_rev_8_21_14_0_10_43_136]|uniref:ATP synthase subunit b n=2 Tax=Parcubacteria group TaxID=1794811 RepID=A0A2M7Q697_9BACT|nr:MAG: ATP synthase F0 subunit B [Candidatus Nomurabacteria bacterium CG2_30_43_9]PIQ35992.1 MAG: ATP synthase F0 subunit B [Candidatus Yonathbacteria bacterium CG17_big_fil_post_rev_8_21_14_2_50_43_9]PIR40885.1 MAG: ATP synthase F0 subunit B [Candidatus Yonathbacteria bacterium CG10_big_fil_rev_8_21_14_0_10_43_136]PIX57153.1 MAG: ATP synthase F0 subunit B [Candidatus Yonathbacteria bacterium CG_4_10_14_3_um_filter_43_12]PIY58484.1 MAG: ATP synthase F0 subunit B [Candidatus Yonathbacteria bact
MEQILDVFGINWKLLVVQMINFGLLLLVLYIFLYKPVLAMVDVRRKKIERAIQDAEEADRQLGEAEAEKARIIREATMKGDDIIDSAKKHAETSEITIMKDAHQKAVHLLNEAERRTARDREEMIQKAEREVARMAVLSAEKILSQGALKK